VYDYFILESTVSDVQKGKNATLGCAISLLLISSENRSASAVHEHEKYGCNLANNTFEMSFSSCYFVGNKRSNQTREITLLYNLSDPFRVC
jgi:hypothetical protein